MGVFVLVLAIVLQQPRSIIEVVVTGDSGPIPRAQVVISGNTSETNAEGRVTLQVSPGEVQITVIGQRQILTFRFSATRKNEQHPTSLSGYESYTLTRATLSRKVRSLGA